MKKKVISNQMIIYYCAVIMLRQFFLFRKQALEVERARAAEIASMPPPPPDPLQNLEVKKSSKFKFSSQKVIRFCQLMMLHSFIIPYNVFICFYKVKKIEEEKNLNNFFLFIVAYQQFREGQVLIQKFCFMTSTLILMATKS